MHTALRAFPVLLRLSTPAVLLAVALLVVGCKESGASNAVSGTCTMKNGDKVSGTVVFVSGGKEYYGPLLDGNYTVVSVPKGECDVLVKGTSSGAGPAPVVPKDVKDGSNMPGLKMGAAPPEKYSRPGALPKYTVKGGKETYNIVLDP